MQLLFVSLKRPITLVVTQPSGTVFHQKTRTMLVEWPTKPNAVMGKLKPEELVDGPLVLVDVTGMVPLSHSINLKTNTMMLEEGKMWDLITGDLGGPYAVELSTENIDARQFLIPPPPTAADESESESE